MKLCRKCKGYGYLQKHKNKPLRMCKKCDGWGKTAGAMTNERSMEISRAMNEALKNTDYTNAKLIEAQQRLTKKLSRKCPHGQQTLDDSLGIYRLE